MPFHGDSRSRTSGGGLGLDKAVLPSRVGLHFADPLPFESWKRIGKQISLISDAATWWLGDWLVFGEDKYPDRYKDAIAQTALDYQTLRNYAWVARKFPMSRRRDRLSMQHHEVVASLPGEQQDLWLDQAEKLKWSRNEMRKQLRLHRASMEKPRHDPLVSVLLNVTADRERRWLHAAKTVNRDLQEWIAEALDNAAESLLRATEDAPESLIRPA